MTRALVVGAGGREHALAWRMTRAEGLEHLLVAPGNPGTAALERTDNLPYKAERKAWAQLKAAMKSAHIDLTIIGPERPLAGGFVDYLRDQGIDGVFGPSKAAARLESDKFFSHELMEELAIPHARGRCCTTHDDARAAIKHHASEHGVVLKTRGLAAGKGVRVYACEQDALDDLAAFEHAFGYDTLVCERLVGPDPTLRPEFSVFAVCDGTDASTIPLAVQDYKQLHQGDQGPNTGGMGAYTPVAIAPRAVVEQVGERVLRPVVERMARNGAPYIGFLYAGMMQTAEGPKLLEFNVRMGDPECQPLMILVDDGVDLAGNLYKAALGRGEPLTFKHDASCCLVIAALGYPHTPLTHMRIGGVDQAQSDDHVQIFHAGTALDEQGRLVSAGGRVLNVAAYGDSLERARCAAYNAAALISIDGGWQLRDDIGEE